MSELWCMHVLGPDDLHPAPSKEAAERVAARLNEVWAKREKHPLDPHISFVVEPWTGSAEAHKRYAETWDDRLGITAVDGGVKS